MEFSFKKKQMAVNNIFSTVYGVSRKKMLKPCNTTATKYIHETLTHQIVCSKIHTRCRYNLITNRIIVLLILLLFVLYLKILIGR